MPGYGSQAKKETSQYVPFTSYDPSVAAPGAATVNTCRVHVPFRHKLCRAFLTVNDIDNVGAISATLKTALSGGAKAGTTVGSAIADATLASTSDTVSTFEFTLAQADSVERAACTYHVALTGDNVSDRIEAPTLALLVIPSNRKRV